MKISSIEYSNLDKLYDLATNEESSHTSNYLKSMNKITNKVTITMSIEGVTPYDMLFFNKLNFIYNGLEENIDLEKEDSKIDDDMNKSVVKMYRLLNYYEEQEKSKIYQYLLPNYIYRHKIDLIFTGNFICNLFEYDIKEIFTNNKTQKILDLSEEDKIKDNMARGFIKSFYKKQYDYYSNVDIISESLETTSFFNMAKNEGYTLHQILGPKNVQVDFINTESNKLSNQYSLFKLNYDKRAKSEYKVLIECKSTFQTLIDLIINTKCVDSYENPIIMLNSKDFYVPKEFVDKYSARYTENLNAMVVLRDFHNTDKDLIKYGYIPMNTMVKYSLLIPFTELTNDSSVLNDFINDEIKYIQELKEENYTVICNDEIQNLNNTLNQVKKLITI